MNMKWFWMWIGGAIGRVAGTGLVIGIFIVVYGAAPGQAVADLLTHLPPWLTNPWFRLALVVIGLFIIGASLHFNVWSLRQKAIDDLAEDLSWAISNLLNKPGRITKPKFIVWYIFGYYASCSYHSIFTYCNTTNYCAISTN